MTTYSPPPLSTQLKCSSACKEVDTHLVKLQKQVTKLTRPVDALVHQGLTITSEKDELMEAVLSYAQGMRLQLSDLADTINRLRTDLVDKDKRVYNVDTEDFLITPQQLVGRVKAGKALANAFKENGFDKTEGNLVINDASRNSRHTTITRTHTISDLRNNRTITITVITMMTMPCLGPSHLNTGTREKSVPTGSHADEANIDDERTGSRRPAPEVRRRMPEYFRPPGYCGHSAGRIQDSIHASASNLTSSTTRPSDGIGRHGGTRQRSVRFNLQRIDRASNNTRVHQLPILHSKENRRFATRILDLCPLNRNVKMKSFKIETLEIIFRSIKKYLTSLDSRMLFMTSSSIPNLENIFNFGGEVGSTNSRLCPLDCP
ncbi:hypothetical protein BGX27_000229 [Mortierella sp. AM989]|nr:hypothetical protein BGX27_000229 [Mortierella sp. AM989]